MYRKKKQLKDKLTTVYRLVEKIDYNNNNKKKKQNNESKKNKKNHATLSAIFKIQQLCHTIIQK